MTPSIENAFHSQRLRNMRMKQEQGVAHSVAIVECQRILQLKVRQKL